MLIYSTSSEDFDKRQMSIRVHKSTHEYKSIEFWNIIVLSCSVVRVTDSQQSHFLVLHFYNLVEDWTLKYGQWRKTLHAFGMGSLITASPEDFGRLWFDPVFLNWHSHTVCRYYCHFPFYIRNHQSWIFVSKIVLMKVTKELINGAPKQAWNSLQGSSLRLNHDFKKKGIISLS